MWRTDDGVRLRFYGPAAPYITCSRSDINSYSLVFDWSTVHSGCSSPATQGRKPRNGCFCHHGSAYGTTPDFVRAVAPKAAVISVRRNNLFGHPAPATIAVLRNAGTEVYRTDENGAVMIPSDGRSFLSLRS